MGTAQLGASLSEAEVERIGAFLSTTTGKQPRVEYPILPAASETTPKPTLD